jgi:hypothetical protein
MHKREGKHASPTRLDRITFVLFLHIWWSGESEIVLGSGFRFWGSLKTAVCAKKFKTEQRSTFIFIGWENRMRVRGFDFVRIGRLVENNEELAKEFESVMPVLFEHQRWRWFFYVRQNDSPANLKLEKCTF